MANRPILNTLFAGIILLLVLTTNNPAYAQSIETWVDYRYGEEIVFHALIPSETPIVTAIIFMQATNDSNTIVGLTDIRQPEDQLYELEYTHDLNVYTFPAFSKIEYHYEITYENNETLITPLKMLYYEDNRIEWNTLEESPFKVHWYQGDIQFAQDILDTAQTGLQQIQKYLILPKPAELDIYIYADNFTMKEVLYNNREDWVAGHADPELEVIVVEIPNSPDQPLIMKQRIPHELLHILLFQATVNGYDNIPTWLNEGLAANAEIYPNPDYRIALKNATERDNLIPMTSLCHSFPRNNADAILSYAQSQSFTDYLHQKYGTPGLEELITNYANGVDCERGVELAFSTTINQIEKNWKRQIMSENSVKKNLNHILVLVILFIALLIVPLTVIIQNFIHRKLSKKISNSGINNHRIDQRETNERSN